MQDRKLDSGRAFADPRTLNILRNRCLAFSFLELLEKVVIALIFHRHFGFIDSATEPSKCQ